MTLYNMQIQELQKFHRKGDKRPEQKFPFVS